MQSTKIFGGSTLTLFAYQLLQVSQRHVRTHVGQADQQGIVRSQDVDLAER